MVDNGKTIQTVNIINNVIKTGGSSSKTIVKVFERGRGDGKPSDCKKDPTTEGCPPPPDYKETPKLPGCPPEEEPPIRYCTQGMDANSIACREGRSIIEVCNDYPDISGCKEPEQPEPAPPVAIASCDPNTQSCPPAGDPCEEDPTAEGCKEPEPIEDLELIEDPADEGDDGEDGEDDGSDGDGGESEG